MTREQAVKASLALQKVDDFRVFMDEVEALIGECEVMDFRNQLMSFLELELERRETILREL